MLPAAQQCCSRASKAVDPSICLPLEGSGPSWKEALTECLRWVSICDVCALRTGRGVGSHAAGPWWFSGGCRWVCTQLSWLP